ncbi:MAG: 30S ribosomal protein S19e [Candidatus Aenigmarchaeota archaeon]|nr:30S ribosomal protein S19e [Candidatus Aenigmarchaeota archaeon]
MTTVYDVDANKLVEKIAAELKNVKEIKAPEWAAFVKTGISKEKIPYQEDWWHMRAAAIFRRLYLEPMGVSRLRKAYGSRKNRGFKPEKFFPASGNIIRKILQQLEAAKFVKKDKKGRVITPLGQKFLNKTASDIFVAPKKEEKPVVEAKKEEIKVEAVKEESKNAPKKEEPKVKESSKAEALKKEEPKAEVKKEEPIAKDAPKAEEPKKEAKK